MFVSLDENKYQIILSTILGSLYFYFTNDELGSLLFTIVTIIFFRIIKIDSLIKVLINYRKI